MLIREAQVADIPAYMEVRLAVRENVLSNPGRVTHEDNVDYLTRRGKGWVAEAGGRIVGFAVADLQDHSIWALFVQPDFDRQGIGRTLHDTMLNWYFSQTDKPLWLSTEPGTRAAKFYEQAGWRNVGAVAGGEVKFAMAPLDWETNRLRAIRG